jgi:hypothetical protein
VPAALALLAGNAAAADPWLESRGFHAAGARRGAAFARRAYLDVVGLLPTTEYLLHRRTPVVRRLCLASLCLLLTCLLAADESAKRTPKEALQTFNDLIGNWRGIGEPATGSREEKQKGFWEESISWEWRFKSGDAWLCAAIDKGKHFSAGELRYLPERDVYALELTTPAKETLTFEGTFKDKRLTLERHDEARKEDQRLVFSLLHSNRHLVRYETRKAEQRVWKPLWQVGATKKGVPFASTDNGPECVVSGGLGTIPVSYKGKTYYVCCTGCRDAFKDEPEKYIKEYEARKKAKQ